MYKPSNLYIALFDTQLSTVNLNEADILHCESAISSVSKG